MTAESSTGPRRSTRRRIAIAAGVLLALALLFAAGFELAVQQLRARVVAALGPRASVGAIEAHLSSVDIIDLRLKAAPGWPAADELRARRVRIVPDLRSLLGARWRIAQIEVEGAYLSALRTHDGHLRLLPGLLDTAPTPSGRAAPKAAATSSSSGGAPPLDIAHIHLADASLAFFDGSVSQPPLALQLGALDLQADSLRLPELDRPIALKLAATLKGPQHDGHLALEGRYTPATRDAEIDAHFTGVDLVGLQPYLLKVSDAGVKRGSADLEMNATVVHNRLHAPGRIVLTQLDLASDGPLATFAGVPKKAVLAALTEKGQLEIRFTLEGRLDDPDFSLNENLATRVASGLAESVGVSVSGVVKGLGGLVKGLFGR